MSASNQQRWTVVTGLAIADLRYELILTACIVLALTAIIAPLLLLLGLKNGVVEYQLKQLIEDPVYRELKPEQNEELQLEWIQTMAERPNVDYIVPSVLRGSSSVSVGTLNGSSFFLDLVPSGIGDPLVLENDSVEPKEGEVVLSHIAAERISEGVEPSVAIGDVISIVVSRGISKRIDIDLKVVGILAPRADTLARLYVPFSFVEDIETYRSGAPVMARGWPGDNPVPFETFDALITVGTNALSETEQLQLRGGTGVYSVEPVAPEELENYFGSMPTEGMQSLMLKAKSSTLGRSNLNAAKNRLRGKGQTLLPIINPINISTQVGDVRSDGKLLGVGWPTSISENFKTPKLPWTGQQKNTLPFSEIAKILVPASSGFPEAGSVKITADLLSDSLTFDAQIAGYSDREEYLAPPALVGMLRTGQSTKIGYDPEIGSFSLIKSGYRGFRLYARSIYDVAELEKDLLAQGIRVLTRKGAIDRVQRIEKTLTRLFSYVATIGVVGAVLALSASLYASVERKHASIGIIRLIGIPRQAIMVFPVAQSAVIGLVSGLMAVGVYLVFAALVNINFAEGLPFGSKLVLLPPRTLLMAVLLTPVVCALSSAFASLRTTRIDPADAIRVE